MEDIDSKTADTSPELDKYRPFTKFGFYDIMFIDNSHNVIASLKKESDYGKNIFSNNSLFGELQNHYSSLNNPGEAFISCSFEYKPSGNIKSFFIGLKGETGTTIAQIDLEKAREELFPLETEYSYLVRSNDEILFYSGDLVSSEIPGEKLLSGRFSFNGDNYLSSYNKFSILNQEIQVISLSDITVLEADMKKTANYSYIFTLLVALLGALGVYLFSRTLSNPLSKFKERLKTTANGDLTVNFESKNRKDEISEMATAFNIVANSLKLSIKTLQELSEAVSNSSVELADNSSDISQRTQEQAASVEELSSSMEELNSNFEILVEDVEFIDHSMSGVREKVKDGKAMVNRSYENLNEIENLGKEITGISDFVNEIAFQTNLLSLNAAVEATRAGENGRGFAVIAAEIRDLSQKTMAHSKSINEIIEKSKYNLKETVRDITRIKDSYENIAVSTDEVGKSLNERMVLLEEQKSAVSEVTEVITDINATVQGNASIVEELAATAENLSAAAEELKILLKKYKVEKNNEEKTVEKNSPSNLKAIKMEKY